jgi:hypothetical protein
LPGLSLRQVEPSHDVAKTAQVAAESDRGGRQTLMNSYERMMRSAQQGVAPTLSSDVVQRRLYGDARRNCRSSSSSTPMDMVALSSKRGSNCWGLRSARAGAELGSEAGEPGDRGSASVPLSVPWADIFPMLPVTTSTAALLNR